MKKKVVFGLIAVLAAMVMMGAGKNAERKAALEQTKPVRTEPKKQPKWVSTPTKNKTKLYFVGISRAEATVSDAQMQAQLNGSQQLVQYFGVFMKNAGVELNSRYGLANETFSPQVAEQDVRKWVSESLTQALLPEERYTEYYIDKTNSQAVVVYALMGIEKSRVKTALENFAKEQAAKLQQKAAAEQDAARREQTVKAAEALQGYINGWLD